MKQFFTTVFSYCIAHICFSQNYWQQSIDYKMNIDFDVKKNQFTGDQILRYTNNSPDTLSKVFYHLYFNAFQPGSMMDVRSRTIEDPDGRVEDRIFNLSDEEIGFQKVKSLTQDGKNLSYHVQGTVLEVKLSSPIIPGASTVFEMSFEGQVPLQIRRSGRDNAEGIEYSMSQWYPKMAEYDERGWHAHPYIAREFHAPWGDFEVNISIAKDYVVAGTGVLQNPEEIGYGYQSDEKDVKRKGKKITYKFKAEKVHDFVWAADPDYKHVKIKTPNDGPLLHFFFQETEDTKAWEQLPELTAKAFEFIGENFGEYPYSNYSVIQGGDGGMEYPMATLITGHRNLNSLLGVTVHEALHSWYQGLLATNESYFAWMDEGFTTYASAETMAAIFSGSDRTQARNYKVYTYLTTTGKEEPLSTHSDHFNTNSAYGLGSYYKGAIALAQMNYLVGKEVTASALKKYYYQWRFKHPDANDWIRVFEKESGLELDWYLDYWVNTTHTIDYTFDSVYTSNEKMTSVALKRVGKMPMPIDITVKLTDGTSKEFYIPLAMMRGEKASKNMDRKVLPDWSWTHPNYSFEIDLPIEQIESVIIDDSGYMADVNRDNNRYSPGLK